MWLPTSPHVELMEIFRDHGQNKEKIKLSRYYMDRQYRRVQGQTRWTDSRIWEHIKKRHKTFKSIKKHGFDKSRCTGDPIRALNKPFWSTRYGAGEAWLYGPEIWNGAGRLSALYVLGVSRVPVVIMADVRPGTGRSCLDKKLPSIPQ